jgi:hypothetical protein
MRFPVYCGAVFLRRRATARVDRGRNSLLLDDATRAQTSRLPRVEFRQSMSYESPAATE